MSTTYLITMENGTELEIVAWDAAQAMHFALHRVRGHGVRSCVAGAAKARKLKEPQLFDSYGAGRITFEVPRHDPLPLEPAPGRQRMCAAYVRAGDQVEDGVIVYLVERVRPLPKKVLFELKAIRSSQCSSMELMRDKLIWATPADPNEIPAS